MKVLKFVGDVELPEIEYLEEALGLGDVYSIGYEGYEEFTETIGFNDILSTITELSLTETIGLGETYTIILSESLIETLGLGDYYYQPDYITIFESLGLGDDLSHTMDIYVEIDETIGFGDEGYAYVDTNYNLIWRTRTKKLNYGFGAAPFGDTVSYGDGEVIDELKEFKVKVIRLSDSVLLRTATITIANKQFPDGSAQYAYTIGMNVSDNGYFEPNLRFEVYQVDVNDNWSPAKYIDITVTDGGGDFI